MRVLVALDKFKDALSSPKACRVAARAIKAVQPSWEVDVCPLSDGGDGFEEIISEAVGAQRIPVQATGPLGGLTAAHVGLVAVEQFPAAAQALLRKSAALPTQARVAIIEMAQVSGLALVPLRQRDPWLSTSHGTGQLIRAAAELGAKAIVLGVGGSATIDLGLGALSALGLEFRDATGAKLRPPLPRKWPDLAHIEGAVFPSIPPILVATDVVNPLLGAKGAAAQYGPQKGLAVEDVERMDDLAQRVARKLVEHCGESIASTEEPGAGAAGGIAFGLRCAARARIISGATFVSHSLDLEARVSRADVVVTGEGRFDATSLAGKAPGAILALARAHGKPAHLFAGQITPADLGEAHPHPLNASGPATSEMLANTASTLARAVEQAFGRI